MSKVTEELTDIPEDAIVIDPEEVVDHIEKETGIDRDTIERVLGSEFNFMVEAGVYQVHESTVEAESYEQLELKAEKEEA